MLEGRRRRQARSHHLMNHSGARRRINLKLTALKVTSLVMRREQGLNDTNNSLQVYNLKGKGGFLRHSIIYYCALTNANYRTN